MARLLIKAFDRVHPDAGIDKVGSYKRGDVIAVMPADHVWGALEGLPNFLQLDVAGTLESLAHLSLSETETAKELTTASVRKMPKLLNSIMKNADRKILTRRQFTLDLSGVSFVDGFASVPTITTLNKRVY